MASRIRKASSRWCAASDAILDRLRTGTLLAWALVAACGQPVDAASSCGADDADGDGVCDPDDLCPGFDDAADADGDGTADGCDPCPLDAADDSDGDGVCDAEDPCPLDAADDSDGDGVCDGEDPCPLDAADDSDGDGVCDSDDLCPDGDDALDGDGDGVPDACDPCPRDARDDRDGDGACDSDDPCPDDDPDDTDGDGVCNSWDICPGLDDDLDVDLDGVPDGCVCSVLDIPGPVGIPNVGGAVIRFGFGFEGIVNHDAIADYGFGVPRSALLRMSFHDGVQFFCSAWWDLSEPGVATPSQADWVGQLPVAPFVAWDVVLPSGQTDCANFPVADMTGTPLGLAIGPMHDLEALLRADPVVDATWASDWEPYVMSLYVYDPGAPPMEVSYVRQFDRTCETLKQDPHTGERLLLPRAEAGPLLEYYEATPVVLLGCSSTGAVTDWGWLAGAALLWRRSRRRPSQSGSATSESHGRC